MNQIVLDVGTTTTRMSVPARGVWLSRPTMLVVARPDDAGHRWLGGVPQRIAHGLRGRLPSDMHGIRPIEGGLIANPQAVRALLQQAIEALRAVAPVASRPAVTLSVPGCADEHERASWREALKHAGASKIWLVDKPLAAARAAGIAAADTTASLVLDIGGGATEISVIAQGRLVQHALLPVAGEALDRAIIRYVRERHALYLGEQTAEALKQQIGCGHGSAPSSVMRVVGKALLDGIPRAVDVSVAGITLAIRAEMQRIMLALRRELERASAPLLADIMERGVVLVGGSAMLPGLDRTIWEEAGLKAVICPEPSSCVIRGSLDARGCAALPVDWPPSGAGSRKWPAHVIPLT